MFSNIAKKIKIKYNKEVELKKYVFLIFFIVIVGLAFIGINIFKYNYNKKVIQNENLKYISDKDNIVQINKVITIMNKAIESNKKNGISQNEKNEFIENDSNSIKVYMKIESRDSIIPMEALIFSKNGGNSKVENLFSDVLFKFDTIEYHKKSGRIKKIVFKAIE